MAKQRLRELAERNHVSEWVHERPLEALAVAFGAGFLAGLKPDTRFPLAELLSRILMDEFESRSADRHD